MTAHLAALPKDWDRDPMPDGVRDLVRDLLRVTEKEGAK